MTKISNLTLITLFALFFSCNSKNNDDPTNTKYTKIDYVQNDCDNEVSFGNTPICLMKIDGMNECYSNPIIKMYMNQFKVKNEVILGYYINDDTYSKIDNIGNFTFDDYFKVYSADMIKNIDVSYSDFEKINLLTIQGFEKKKWPEMNEKFKDQLPFASFDRPIVLDSYSPHKNIRSHTCLMKIESNGLTTIFVATINVAYIKDTIIYYCYYKNFSGNESIEKAKANSDYFGLKFYEANS